MLMQQVIKTTGNKQAFVTAGRCFTATHRREAQGVG